MTIWNAIILGLVQGIAEFLPISSSGHFSIINNLFDMTTAENGHFLFQVMLHLATLASVCVVYWQDIVNMYREILALANAGPLAGQKQRRYPAARMFLMIVLSTFPLALVLPFMKRLDGLFYQNIFIGIALILTGCVLFVNDKMLPGKKTENNMTVLDSVLIGLCQVAGAIPGISRSAVTITGGIAVGLRRDYAVKFSFLMSIPAVLGATVFELIDAFQSSFEWSNMVPYLIGMVVAFNAGIMSLSLLKQIAAKGKFGGFAYYCWIVGVLSIILSMIF